MFSFINFVDLPYHSVYCCSKGFLTVLFHKALHVVFVIFWMAGLLYFYRLLAYHSKETEINIIARFRLMEKRLYFYITLPAAFLALATGLHMVVFLHEYYMALGWFHAKLTLGILLFFQTLWGWHFYRKLGSGKPVSPIFLRVLNELTTIAVILIVFLAILEPAH